MDPTQLPWRRSPQEFQAALDRWVQAKVAPGSAVVDLAAPGGSGMSSETLLFAIRDAGGHVERYVARLEPDPRSYPVFPSYDLARQQRCMRLVAEHTPVPVPTTPWYEPDASWLGSPFLVMGRIDGQAPADIPPYTMTGWLFDMPPERRAQLQRNVVHTMAALHSIRADAVDLSFLDDAAAPGDAIDRHLAAQRAYYDWARDGVRYPLIERTFDWLIAHRPPVAGPTVLNWGDARIGNILFDDVEPVAVLDWEMAAVGPAEVDVAWVIWMHRFFQDLAERYGGPGLPGFLDRADVAREYEQASGHAVDDLHWFIVFAALRHAIITVRTTLRTVTFGMAEMPADVDDVVGFRSLIEAMIDGS